MRRVMIIGCMASGKSTLARELSERTGLPIIHLDRLHWLPGWVEREREAFQAELSLALDGEEWIVDGNYLGSGLTEKRLERCDTLIFFDLPAAVCVWHVLSRVTRYRGRTRPDMGDGCGERFDLLFLRDVISFRKWGRPKDLELTERAKAMGKCVVVLKSTREKRALLKQVDTQR